jgi:hypothetical protein
VENANTTLRTGMALFGGEWDLARTRI